MITATFQVSFIVVPPCGDADCSNQSECITQSDCGGWSICDIDSHCRCQQGHEIRNGTHCAKGSVVSIFCQFCYTLLFKEMLAIPIQIVKMVPSV